MPGPETGGAAERGRESQQREFQQQELVEQHYAQIRRAAWLLTGNRCDAEDLAQETFVQAMLGWERFEGRCDPSTWLYGILLNLHRRRIRGRGRTWRRLWGWWDRRGPSPSVDPAAAAIDREWERSIWRRVAGLPEAQRAAVLLRYAEELSLERIAEIQRCPVGTVKSRLHHALRRLRSELGDEPCAVVKPRVLGELRAEHP